MDLIIVELTTYSRYNNMKFEGRFNSLLSVSH
jgi:hypothetical protein